MLTGKNWNHRIHGGSNFSGSKFSVRALRLVTLQRQNYIYITGKLCNDKVNIIRPCHPSDADDAIRSRNGYDFEGYRLRVERCRGGRDRDRSPPRYGGSSYYRGRGRGGGDRGGGRHPNIPRRSDYRVKVGGLPPTGSWQVLQLEFKLSIRVCIVLFYHLRHFQCRPTLC